MTRKWRPPGCTEFARRRGGERGRKGRIKGRRTPLRRDGPSPCSVGGGWEVEVGGLCWGCLEGIGGRHEGHQRGAGLGNYVLGPWCGLLHPQPEGFHCFLPRSSLHSKPPSSSGLSSGPARTPRLRGETSRSRWLPPSVPLENLHPDTFTESF